MKAKLICKDRVFIISKETICEMIIWQLPVKNKERPHGLKYRLHFGRRDGTCLVRYDNEQGKGDHRHYLETEESYEFTTVEKLIADFLDDVQSIRGE